MGGREASAREGTCRTRQSAVFAAELRAILAAMRTSLAPRALRPMVALAALVALGMFGAVACEFEHVELWVCLNPATGKLDSTIYDENNFVNGKIDPCHCYDSCGPADTCPIVVDAGEPGPGCDAGDGG